MTATIKEYVDRAAVVAHDDPTPAAGVAQHEVATIWNLAVVREKDPVPAEDPLLLERENLRITVNAQRKNAAFEHRSHFP